MLYGDRQRLNDCYTVIGPALVVVIWRVSCVRKMLQIMLAEKLARFVRLGARGATCLGARAKPTPRCKWREQGQRQGEIARSRDAGLSSKASGGLGHLGGKGGRAPGLVVVSFYLGRLGGRAGRGPALVVGPALVFAENALVA